MQDAVKRLVSSSYFQNFIIALIIINGITLGIETTKYFEDLKYFVDIFDKIVITIFTVEIALRIYAYRIDFFKDGWSIFDFVIVAISLFPTSSGFEIFRILRVLRLFRLVTVAPAMRKIVATLISTLPAIATIAGLLLLLFYIFAIIATQLYGETHPELFGDLGESFYTLFQVMTLESWSMEVVKPLMEKHHPYAWAFFIPFIFIVTFIMVNLIVAIVVDAMNELNRSSTMEIEREIEKDIVITKETLNEISRLREEIAELKQVLADRKTQETTSKEKN